MEPKQRPIEIDIEGHETAALILTAIKSEVDSQRVYSTLADRVSNAFLKDKLGYLAGEEAKHQQHLEQFFRDSYPEQPVEIPTTAVVPLPEVDIDDETIPLSEVLGQAMDAEAAAEAFYTALIARVEDADAKQLLGYFAKMERGHYQLLATEKENAEQFEMYDSTWPMMHAGP